MVLTVAAAALLTVVSGAAPAADMVSHRALYSMTLHSARSGSGITAVSGEMAVDWSASCAGWTFEHRSVIDVSFNNRNSVRLGANASSWESLNGLQYRFSIRNRSDGKITETVAGAARLDVSGGTGQVDFTAPKRRKMILPAGTMFPVAHSIALIEAAARAPTMVTRTVFDGMSFEGAFQLSAAVGAPTRRKTADGNGLQALANRRYWPVQLAFFPIASAAATPDHEVGMHMYDNGIADELLVNFGDFTVRSRLLKLKVLKSPAC